MRMLQQSAVRPNLARAYLAGPFPDTYPDELLYSACARFDERVAPPGNTHTMRELFGAVVRVSPLLPNRLDHLAGVVPSASCIDVEDLIRHHTLFPYFAPFVGPERADRAQLAMLGSGGHASALLGANTAAVEGLWYCPECVAQDTIKCGEPYWHRVHQVPGIQMCVEHRVWLEYVPFGVGFDVRPFAFRSLRSHVAAAPRSARALPPDHPWLPTLQRMCEDARWLLSKPAPPLTAEELHRRYLQLLTSRRLATHSGFVWRTRLLDEFRHTFPEDLLDRLSGHRGRFERWVARLARGKMNQPPIHHLLFLQFLGIPAAEFLSSRTLDAPFGNGPWPCLNRAADHYGAEVIATCRLSTGMLSGRPVGQFACDLCGFTYTRMGPDEVPADRLRHSNVLSVGEVWERRLKDLWMDETVTTTALARDHLGVHFVTVQRHADRLGLPSPRPGSHAWTATPTRSPTRQERRAEHRLAYEAARRAAPDASRSESRGDGARRIPISDEV